MRKLLNLAVALIACFQHTNAQGCSALVPSGSVRPTVASGYQWQLVATGLSKPRGIKFDNSGNLLVVESGLNGGSLSMITLKQNGVCVSVRSKTTLISNQQLNHGVALSVDGKTLYASSSNSVWSWAYNPAAKTATNQKMLITNMTTDDHTTRTLLVSKKVPGAIIVSRGSTSNIDIAAADISSGHSQIKAFDLSRLASSSSAYQFDTSGLRLGWGLRNSVGVGEHPNSGGIYSVENSADQIMRDGQDVHENNPGEEMNFHGYLNGTAYANQGKNYGYPWCFAAWNVSELPNNSKLKVGSQFAIDASSASDNQMKTDAYCATLVPPRITFQAHMAPLDIKFRNAGKEAWVSFHGSWDRTIPVGYKVALIAFNADGTPVDPSTSTTAAKDIFYNHDITQCPGNCFRPVGLAIDSASRVFVSSDATGEIYMISQTSGGSFVPSDSASSTLGSGPTVSATGASTTSTSGSAGLSWRLSPSSSVWTKINRMGALLAFFVLMVLL